MRRAARGLALVLATAFAPGAGAGGPAQHAAKSPPHGGGFPIAPWGARIWFVDAAGMPPGSGTFADPYTDLAAALATPALAPGDQVVVAPGIYPGPVLAPAFGVSVVSTQGAASTVIDGLGLAPALCMDGTDGVPLVFDGFTLENGAGSAVPPIFSAGGGLQAVDARFELRNCVIRHNDAFFGGGVMSKNSVGVLRQCSIEDNTNTGFGGRGAGVLADGGSLAIESSAICSNASGDFFAPGNGGGIYAQGGVDLDVSDTRIELNVAELGGGGVFGSGDYVDCTLRANQGQFGGGANATSATSFTGCLIEANAADSLGGTSHFGGGVWGPATLSACTVRGNLAWGGVAGVDGGLLLSCEVEENLAVPGFGGVNDLSGGVARGVILDSTLSGNVAEAGGLYFARGGGAAQSTLVDCDLVANEARSDPGAEGGGVHACDVRDSRLHDNLSSGAGGGAYGGTLIRCLLYDNQAEGGGGAADAELDHCTLEGNHAAVGDGIWVGPNVQVAVSNSILYGNDDEEIVLDASATAVVTFSDVLGGWPGSGNIDLDPLFVAPGPHDYNLGSNSPCIDRGDPTFAPDPDGSRTDMGALLGVSKHYTNAKQQGGLAAKP